MKQNGREIHALTRLFYVHKLFIKFSKFLEEALL